MNPKELAQVVESMWCNGSVHEPTARAVKDALDELARIKATALPHEAERIHRLHHAALTRLGIENTTQAGKDANTDRATLLDALRAKEAECQELRDNLEYEQRVSAKQIDEVRATRSAACDERDAARAEVERLKKELGLLAGAHPVGSAP